MSAAYYSYSFVVGEQSVGGWRYGPCCAVLDRDADDDGSVGVELSSSGGGIADELRSLTWRRATEQEEYFTQTVVGVDRGLRGDARQV